MLPRDSEEREHCRKALSALERVLEHRPERRHDALIEAVRCLVAVRDHLIWRRRRGGSPDLDGKLAHVNAVLSVMHAGSFPMVGLKHDRLEKARDLLAKTLEESPPA